MKFYKFSLAFYLLLAITQIDGSQAVPVQNEGVERPSVSHDSEILLVREGISLDERGGVMLSSDEVVRLFNLTAVVDEEQKTAGKNPKTCPDPKLLEKEMASASQQPQKVTAKRRSGPRRCIATCIWRCCRCCFIQKNV